MKNNVQITAVGFGRNMITLPKRMEWHGKTYTFIDGGIRVTMKSGDIITNIFNLSDGRQTFRLQQRGNIWTLLGVH